jgi:hypothetical protein
MLWVVNINLIVIIYKNTQKTHNKQKVNCKLWTDEHIKSRQKISSFQTQTLAENLQISSFVITEIHMYPHGSKGLGSVLEKSTLWPVYMLLRILLPLVYSFAFINSMRHTDLCHDKSYVLWKLTTYAFLYTCTNLKLLENKRPIDHIAHLSQYLKIFSFICILFYFLWP